MILATFADRAKLTALHPLFAQGFDFIEEALKHPPVPGKYDLMGGKLFVRMQEYATNPLEASLWEAHRRYIDIQFMLSGTEEQFWAPLSAAKPGTLVYDDASDLLRCEAKAHSSIVLHPGEFTIFYPEDLHMPSCAHDSVATVQKIVVKVAV